MPHHDGLPLVFQFPEEDTQPESQEHKALWDELELALREDAAIGERSNFKKIPTHMQDHGDV